MKKKINIVTLLVVIALVITAFVLINNNQNGSQPSEINKNELQERTYYRNGDIDNENHVELPKIDKGDMIIQHNAYTLSYNEEHEQAEWVVYLVTRDHVNGEIERGNDFREDEAVETGSAALEDYRKSGYSRGHLVPAGDMKWDETAMSETFLLSNISPQLQEFNAGIWLKLENRVRSWAKIYDSLWVVTGPVLREGLPTIGENEVSVPEYFYKIVYDPEREEMIGWVVPHKAIKTTAPKLAVTVDSIEKLTGIDFFEEMEDEAEERMESHLCKECWNWK